MIMIKRNDKQNVNEIQRKITLNGRINIYELKRLLDSNYEITFEYRDEIYEIIQNDFFIELHYNCFYENKKTKSLSCVKFLNSNEFIENAIIGGKHVVQIINKIKILNC